uniref:homogentisate 1,2-dioxygenase n=1 Tax=Thaumasiovibrio occultus TaxID=1891184 RepID=UPI000B34FF2B|nr:homogentisate 1,2-dioxygenase [Thaumasiovibrio occultus]
MQRPFRFPHVEGQVSRQAHCDLPEHTFEREVSRDGFFGSASHLYHRHMPTGWSGWDGPHRPRAFNTHALKQATPTLWDSPILLENAALQLRFWQCHKPMEHLLRNGDGDLLLFVHGGSGALFCDYGHLPIMEGDYVLIPRGTTWRLEPASPLSLLVIQATRQWFGLPDKGLLGQHAIFDEGVLRSARVDAAYLDQHSEERWQVLLKARDQLNTITYPYNPLDTIGWKGDVTVFALNWRDIRPVMSHRYHLPPSVHTTFLSQEFVVCTFVPRPLEQDDGALKVPFFHSNDDYDEVIFYHSGNFFSRDNIDAGMVTFHPCGFSHGPHPKAYYAQGNHHATDEVAVMIDSQQPLNITQSAQSVENLNYWASWQQK